jgi:hypothetical protein
MAITVTNLKKNVVGDEREHSGLLDLGTYATNGIAYTPGTFGLNKLRQLEVQATAIANSVPTIFFPDTANAKIKAYIVSTAVEVGAVDISATKLTFVARGSV